MEVVEPVGGPGKKRGRKRKIAIVTAAALVVLVGAAPTIVGRVGKGAVESRLSEALGGNVRIEKLGLSWVGGQSVRSLRIVDGSLREMSLEVSGQESNPKRALNFLEVTAQQLIAWPKTRAQGLEVLTGNNLRGFIAACGKVELNLEAMAALFRYPPEYLERARNVEEQVRAARRACRRAPSKMSRPWSTR